MTVAECVEWPCLLLLFWVYATPLMKFDGTLHQAVEKLFQKSDHMMNSRRKVRQVGGSVVFLAVFPVIITILVWALLDVIMAGQFGLDIKDHEAEYMVLES